jgi:hypothetical protein
MFLVIGQPNGPLQKIYQNMYPQLINMDMIDNIIIKGM